MNNPAFRFYPGDFWGSPDVQAMDLHEVAAYLSLLSNAWLSDRPGTLPDDDERLRRWSRLSRDQWTQSRNLLLGKFPLNESGERVNPRLLEEYEKASAYREAQRANGRKGGRPKAKDNPRVSKPNPPVSYGLSQTISQKKLAVAVAVTNKEQKQVLSELRPEFIPSEAWDAYLSVRVARKHPCTPYAIGLIAKKLRKMNASGEDASGALEHSTLGGYPSVYPGSGNKPKQPTPGAIKFSQPEAL